MHNMYNCMRENEGRERRQGTSEKKKRSSGSGRPRSNSEPRRAPHRERSPFKEKLLKYDSSFEHFNLPKYEGEMETLRALEICDYKGIVAGDYDTIAKHIDTCENHASGKTPRTCPQSQAEKDHPSLQVLKKAPSPNIGEHILFAYLDDNSATASSAETEDLHLPLQREKNEIPEADSAQMKYHEGKGVVPEMANDATRKVSELMLTFDHLENLFTNQYKMEAKSIFDSNLEEFEKLEKLNQLYRYWIKDLYEQLDDFTEGFEDFVQAAKLDGLEFEAKIASCVAEIETLKGEGSKLKEKYDSVTNELSRSAKLIKKLQEQKLDDNSEELIQDLNSLANLIIRLRDSKEWDLEGLRLSPTLFSQLFQGHEDILGKRLVDTSTIQNQADGDHHECLIEKRKLEEELLSNELEKLRKQIYKKERTLQKLTFEERSFKSRTTAWETEEAALTGRINQLKMEEEELKKNIDVMKLDHFWKNL